LTGVITCISSYRNAKTLRSSLDAVVSYADATLILEGRTTGLVPLPADETDAIYHDVARRFDPAIYRPEVIGDTNTQKVIYLDTDAMHHTICVPHNGVLVTDDSHKDCKTIEIANYVPNAAEKRDLARRSIKKGEWAFFLDRNEIPIGDVKRGFDIVRQSNAKTGWVKTLDGAFAPYFELVGYPDIEGSEELYLEDFRIGRFL
jgi:hypothetical protein